MDNSKIKKFLNEIIKIEENSDYPAVDVFINIDGQQVKISLERKQMVRKCEFTMYDKPAYSVYFEDTETIKKILDFKKWLGD